MKLWKNISNKSDWLSIFDTAYENSFKLGVCFNEEALV
jgi:hypothetical protein